MPSDASSLREVRVFIALHPAEAHHVKGLLGSVGIDSEIRGEALYGARGEIPIQEASPSVWVLEADADQARELLKDYRSEVAEGSSDAARWTCPTCGERLEGQFTSCWNCGTERSIDLPAT